MIRSYYTRVSILTTLSLVSKVFGYPASMVPAVQNLEATLSAGMVEKMLLVIFLVLIGGVFAGKISNERNCRSPLLFISDRMFRFVYT